MSKFEIPVKAHTGEAAYLRIDVPVNYDEEDIPLDFPGRYIESINDDPMSNAGEHRWCAYIHLETGTWSVSMAGGSQTTIPVLTHSMYMKVCDECCIQVLAANGGVLRTIEDEYVPPFFPGEHFGDYLIFDFADGKITNWHIDPREWREYWESVDR